MGLFRFGRNRDEVIDLTSKKNRQKIKNNSEVSRKFPDKDDSYVSIPGAEDSGSQESGSNMFSFFGNIGSSRESSQDESEPVQRSSEGIEERRKRLAKRLSDLTDQIENISNQIYHLQQRVEVLERKMR